MEKTIDIIGIGNALMDLLVEVDDNTLIEFDLKKGEMHLVDHDLAQKNLSLMLEKNLKIEIIPGGSVANTLKGIALFGGHVVLCGKVGDDDHGKLYIQEMEKMGVSSRINSDSAITGHALTFITPDSERTFSVHLGAAINIVKEDILEEDIAKSKILHLEGYQLEGPTKEIILHAIKLAKKHQTLVSLDLADPALVRRNKELLTKLVTEDIDIVFMNENEAKEFTGKEEKEAIMALPDHLHMAIVKLGSRGSLIRHKGRLHEVAVTKTKPVDTTGAGDSYAAGLLYGHSQGWEIPRAAKLGSLLAAKVIERMGVSLHDISANDLFEQLDAKDTNNQESVDTLNQELADSLNTKTNDEQTSEQITKKKVMVGLIGGSGIGSPDILEDKKTVQVDTEFGKPSSEISVGKINGVDVAIIARHGPGHVINPTNVPYAANIAALKKIGCTHILGASAVGSLQEECRPGDIVFADQFIDRTTKRVQTFYDAKANDTKVCHISVADPMCQDLRNKLIESARNLNLSFHEKGTCVVIEGPRFSTKAESKLFRSWSANIIGMTLVPEAVLAREAEIPYANISLVTDYDVWKEDHSVSTEEVIRTMNNNLEKLKQLLKDVIPKINYDKDNPIRCALKGAMF